jgi:hypothetical protein
MAGMDVVWRKIVTVLGGDVLQRRRDRKATMIEQAAADLDEVNPRLAEAMRAEAGRLRGRRRPAS